MWLKFLFFSSFFFKFSFVFLRKSNQKIIRSLYKTSLHYFFQKRLVFTQTKRGGGRNKKSKKKKGKINQTSKLSTKRTQGTHSDPGPSSPRCSAKTKSSDFTLSSHIYKVFQLFPAAGVGLMETSAGDGHCGKPPALSDHFWYNLWPDSVPSPQKPNQNYIVPPTSPSTPATTPKGFHCHCHRHCCHHCPARALPTSGNTGQGLAEGGGKGGFFKTQFSGISLSGNGGPGGGGSQTRMGSGSHKGEGDRRCYTGEAGGAPAGARLSRGKQPVRGPGSRTTSGC